MSLHLASSKAGENLAWLFATRQCHPTQILVEISLFHGFYILGAGGCLLSPGTEKEGGRCAQPTAGRGGRERGHLPALATVPNTWGGGCSVTSISHSSSSIVCRVTGREELDWTSPDWNKPLLPLLLFTTPHHPPQHCCLSHLSRKEWQRVPGLQSQKPNSWGGG